MAITPREGQIRLARIPGKKPAEIQMTNMLMYLINKEHRYSYRHYKYVRTPFKVMIRHFFQDLSSKLRNLHGQSRRASR